MVNDDLPKADLIILKDVLQHLSNNNIKRVMSKLKLFKYALIINDFSDRNHDCIDGEGHSLNLLASPFNLRAKEVFRFSNCNKIALLSEQ